MSELVKHYIICDMCYTEEASTFYLLRPPHTIKKHICGNCLSYFDKVIVNIFNGSARYTKPEKGETVGLVEWFRGGVEDEPIDK